LGNNFTFRVILYQTKDQLQTQKFHCALDASVSNAGKMVESRLPKSKPSAFSGESFFVNAGFTPTRNPRNSVMTSSPFNPVRILDIMPVADLEYYTIEGGRDWVQTITKIDNQLNLAEAVYQVELGIVFNIIVYHIWDTEDPFTAPGDDVEASLSKFLNYYNSDPTPYGTRDIALLFTGFHIDGGIAYVGTACQTFSNGAAYGLVGSLGPDYMSVPGFIAAHEISHLLGIAAEHNSSQSCRNTITSAFYSTTYQMTFCQEARDTIINWVIANGSCLSSKTRVTTFP